MEEVIQQISDERNKPHMLYGFLSIASPLIAGLGIYLYQTVAYGDFWRSRDTVDSADRMAMAMMASGQAVEWIFGLGIGCLIGLALSLVSLKRAVTVLGSLGLLLNSPLLLLLGIVLVSGFRR